MDLRTGATMTGATMAGTASAGAVRTPVVEMVCCVAGSIGVPLPATAPTVAVGRIETAASDMATARRAGVIEPPG